MLVESPERSRLSSDLINRKKDRVGGRAEREIELGEERRWERHKEDDEHMGKNEPYYK